MVYMSEWIKNIIIENSIKIFEYPTLQEFCFLFLYDKNKLNTKNLDDLLGEEEILAAKGYMGIIPDNDELKIGEKPENNKIVHYKLDKYKLIGICLSSDSNSTPYKYLEEFVANSSSLELFLIQKFFPEFKNTFIEKLKKDSNDNASFKILKHIFIKQQDSEVANFITEISRKDLETIDLIVLAEFQEYNSKQAIQKVSYLNFTSKELILNILDNFENAVTKITDPKERYGGKTANPKKTAKTIISIEDEYDVQDILYVILKSVFPKIKYENPLSKYGGSSTRLDFVLEEEGIIIEVKQIKITEKNDKTFITQIKIDLQSYHVLDYLQDIIFFIYAPNAIQDINNFKELEGEQSIKGKKFNVKVIVIR